MMIQQNEFRLSMLPIPNAYCLLRAENVGQRKFLESTIRVQFGAAFKLRGWGHLVMFRHWSQGEKNDTMLFLPY